ncbi:hypothetical protein TorRG33x02_181450 [Trema orientale]|uniref:Uncharacterized protein n=1 Tax=Trema orientale TaxID=63057 RepID=A0A2P5EKT1_TREOI|nr:hypothetical protein TorRG33x02_181450 [Trema orientale]
MSKLGLIRTAISLNRSMVRTLRTSGYGFRARQFSTESDPGPGHRFLPQNLSPWLQQGVPRNAIFLDIERFLSACEYDASSLQFFLSAGFPGGIAACYKNEEESHESQATVTHY